MFHFIDEFAKRKQRKIDGKIEIQSDFKVIDETTVSPEFPLNSFVGEKREVG